MALPKYFLWDDPVCKNMALAEFPLKALITAHMCEVPGLMSSPCCEDLTQRLHLESHECHTLLQ